MKYTKEYLEPLVKESRSMRDLIVNQLKLRYAGGTFSHLKKVILKHNLDTSHFTGKGWSKGMRLPKYTKESFIKEVCKLNGKGWKSHAIKLKLYSFGILSPKCNICGIEKWLGKNLSLHLDHINGDNKDNRLENLRVLCPNCHSQTDTYCKSK